MKLNRSTIISFVILVISCSLYRVWDARPLGFAPQIAMALFAGSVVKDKKYAFLLPIFSMFMSDVIYQFLYRKGLTSIPGFYTGQWMNYALFAMVTIIGFYIQKNKISSVIVGSLAGVAFFFITSNFMVWINDGLALNNLPYPKTISGLMECYTAGIPFLKGSLWATLLFSGVFFGSYALYNRKSYTVQQA